MKRILFLFTASLLFLACSKDDTQPIQEQEETTEFKIKKFSRMMYEPNIPFYRIDLLFDESGKITNSVKDYYNDNTTYNRIYSYNSLDQVTEIQHILVQLDSLTDKISYTYDEVSHKLQNIKWINYGENEDLSITFTYDGNMVMTEDDFGFKNFNFDANGKLINTLSAFGDIGYQEITENIDYSEDLITSIHYQGSLGASANNTFEYDDKVNPLFQSFNESIHNYIYGFVGNMMNFKYHFSANNYSRIECTSTIDPSYNYTLLKTTQYNEDGYPISAVVKKDDVVIEELTYEYY